MELYPVSSGEAPNKTTEMENGGALINGERRVKLAETKRKLSQH